MKTHLTLARQYWKHFLFPGDTVIDATMGNGHDTFYLAQLLQGNGKIFSYDIQLEAVESTRKRLLELTEDERSTVVLRQLSHERFLEGQAHLIVYNLGYLPGGNKLMTTQVETTLKSVENALQIATKAISITCYPGHEEGFKEENALLEFLKGVPRSTWRICHHQWINHERAPSLLWLERLSS